MRKRLMTLALLNAVTSCACPAYADNTVTTQMLPPTQLGSMTACPGGNQMLLSYSGTPAGGGQGGINCTPVVTDAMGDLAAAGYIQMGQTPINCDGPHNGSLRWNASSSHLEFCSRNQWQALGGFSFPANKTATASFYINPQISAVNCQGTTDASGNVTLTMTYYDGQWHSSAGPAQTHLLSGSVFIGPNAGYGVAIHVNWRRAEGGIGVTACTDQSGQPYIGLYPLNWQGKAMGMPLSFRRRRLMADIVIGYKNDQPVAVFIDAEVTWRGLSLRIPLAVAGKVDVRHW